MPFDPFQDFRMNDHVAIVTGGAQNIGEGIAKAFAGAPVRPPCPSSLPASRAAEP